MVFWDSLQYCLFFLFIRLFIKLKPSKKKKCHTPFFLFQKWDSSLWPGGRDHTPPHEGGAWACLAGRLLVWFKGFWTGETFSYGERGFNNLKLKLETEVRSHDGQWHDTVDVMTQWHNLGSSGSLGCSLIWGLCHDQPRPLQMGGGGFAASSAPACTRHGDRRSCKRVMAPSLCGRRQKGHGENALLWIWAGSKTGESLFGRLSVPVVSTSTCGSSRYGTLKNCTGFQKYRSEVIIDHRNNEMQWE